MPQQWTCLCIAVALTMSPRASRKRLKELLPLLLEGDGGGHIGDWREKTQTFIDGLMRAHEAGEDVEFH